MKGPMSKLNPIEAFIQFLLISPKYTTFTETEKTDPKNRSHDTWRRVLMNMSRAHEALWKEARQHVSYNSGYLVADDTIIDKQRGPKIQATAFHRSGKHKRTVRGICLLSLIWTDGKICIPIDFRIYCKKKDGKTKNEHLQDMLIIAKRRGFSPKYVMFDSWYSSNQNLSRISVL